MFAIVVVGPVLLERPVPKRFGGMAISLGILDISGLAEQKSLLDHLHLSHELLLLLLQMLDSAARDFACTRIEMSLLEQIELELLLGKKKIG